MSHAHTPLLIQRVSLFLPYERFTPPKHSEATSPNNRNNTKDCQLGRKTYSENKRVNGVVVPFEECMYVECNMRVMTVVKIATPAVAVVE